MAVWLGDGRTGAAVGGSARAYHLLTIETDPTKNPVVSNTSGGGITAVIYHSPGSLSPSTAVAIDPAPPLASVTRTASGYTTVVELSADTHDPLVSFAPSLHYDYTMRFDVATGRLTIVGAHGQFPAFDVIVGGKTYVNYVSTGIDNTPLALYFPNMDVAATGTIKKYPCCSK